MSLTTNQHFIVRFFFGGGGSGGGDLAKEYSLYAFINVDNFEGPLNV